MCVSPPNCDLIWEYLRGAPGPAWYPQGQNPASGETHPVQNSSTQPYSCGLTTRDSAVFFLFPPSWQAAGLSFLVPGRFVPGQEETSARPFSCGVLFA